MALTRTSGIASPEEAATAVFGPISRNVTDLKTWARLSPQKFVRSQTQIARWSPEAKGQSISAHEAFSAFGWPVLSQLADNTSAVTVQKGCDAATVLRTRREATGFTRQQVAAKANVPLADLDAAEAGARRSPIRVLTRIAQALALDGDRLGTVRGGGGDAELGVRFRDVQHGPGAMSAAVVLGLAEAAWVIATQSRLEEWLDQGRNSVPGRLGFVPVPTQGTYRPAWRDGMDLAHRARDLMRLGQGAPIRGLKALLEDRLAIPLVQVELPERFAGATIGNGSTRGIAVNMKGINENVWVRRMTMAHELGHLLWDPEEDLKRLRVDDNDVLEQGWDATADKVEARANAFAAEFLAPQSAVLQVYEQAGEGRDGVSAVMRTFGVSFTAARWQIHNGRGGGDRNPQMRAVPGTVPSDDWKADEAAVTDYFVIKETPVARRGRFAELCVRAYKENLISDDTAASYLETDAQTFMDAEPSLTSLLTK